MEKIKLVDYQVKDIKSAIEHSFDIIEDMLLDKYKAFMIEELNASDFDQIMEDIRYWHLEITKIELRKNPRLLNKIKLWKSLEANEGAK